MTEEQNNVVDLVMSDASDNKIITVNSVAGSGKGQPLKTLTPTPNGWVTFGSLKVDDEVFTAKGTVTKVKAIYPLGIKPSYSVKFSDNTSTDCCEDHLWLIYDNEDNPQVCDLKTLKNLLAEHSDKTYKGPYKIPVAKAVPFKQSPDDKVFTNTNAYNTGKLLGVNSSIPAEYKRCAIADRVSLLQGILDKYGIFKHGMLTVFTSSVAFATDLIEVVQSLGGTAFITHGTRARDQYVHMRIPFYPFVERVLDSAESSLFEASNTTPVLTKVIVGIARNKVDCEQMCIEVEDIDHLYLTNDFIVTHNTTTSHEVIKALKPNKGFYTAFNKGIVADSKKKFKGIIEAKTIHSLAYKYINPSKVEELTFDKIKEDITYIEKKALIDALDGFYRSSHLDIEEYLLDAEVPASIAELVYKYAELMYTNKIPCTFNYLLKCLHIMLAHNEVNPTFDLFIFDEFQDVIPVSLEIFKLINSKKKLALGDTHQNIYDFLNTVNGFNLLEDTLKLRLTKSFRCGVNVAEQIQKFGDEYFDDFIFTGNENLDTTYDKNNIVYLSRTNSAMIPRLYNLTEQGKRFSLIRSIDEIFEYPIAIINVIAGKPVFSRRCKYLEIERKKWLQNPQGESFSVHLRNLDIDEINSSLNVLSYLKKYNINIFDLKQRIRETKTDKQITLSTIHSYKGLEKNVAILEKDTSNLISTNSSIPESERIQNLNLYYVALSRAKHSVVKLESLG